MLCQRLARLRPVDLNDMFSMRCAPWVTFEQNCADQNNDSFLVNGENLEPLGSWFGESGARKILQRYATEAKTMTQGK